MVSEDVKQSARRLYRYFVPVKRKDDSSIHLYIPDSFNRFSGLPNKLTKKNKSNSTSQKKNNSIFLHEGQSSFYVWK